MNVPKKKNPTLIISHKKLGILISDPTNARFIEPLPIIPSQVSEQLPIIPSEESELWLLDPDTIESQNFFEWTNNEREIGNISDNPFAI